MAGLWSSDASQQGEACLNNYILFSTPTISQHDPKNYARALLKKKIKKGKNKKKSQKPQKSELNK